MIKEAFASRKYWKGVFWSGFFFVLIITLFEYGISFVRLDWQEFVATHFSGNRWVRFVISRAVGGLLYGLIITFGFFRKNNKSSASR